MSNVNTATVSGNLTRDPELRNLPSGTQVAEMGIAVNRSRKVEDEWVNEASFFDVKVFGNYANLVAEKLHKGSFVSIQAELRQDRWEKEGEKRQKVFLIARQVDGPDMYAPRQQKLTQDDSFDGTTTEPKMPEPPPDDDIPF